MSTTMTSMQEQDSFTPAAREAISLAQREAVRMNATEVSPEHLFLGVLAQDGDGITETFSALRLNQAVLREQATTLFPSHTAATEKGERNVPLSTEAHDCLEWAISFATYQHVSSVQPEHVLLGSVRHQRLQPLLALFLINAGSTLPSSMTELSGRAYSATTDQHIFSRIRRQRVYGFPHRILSSFERPTTLFSDIVGFHEVKQDLQAVLDFLRNPQFVRLDVRSSPYGLLLIGPAGNSRRLIRLRSLVRRVFRCSRSPFLSCLTWHALRVVTPWISLAMHTRLMHRVTSKGKRWLSVGVA